MAKVKGMVTFTGTVGGLNFYSRKGVPLARAAGGGFNGRAIKTSPRMVRVRENSAEFKGCMQSVKHFKQGLNPFFVLIKNGESHERLASLFAKIKNADCVSARGERFVGGGMATAAGRQLLKGYAFNSDLNLGKALHCPVVFSWENGVTIDLAKDAVAFPAAATHLELTALFYIFDFEGYGSVLEKSEKILISKDAAAEETVHLSPLALPEGVGIKIGLVAYRFLQEVNRVLYSLKTQSVGMEVLWLGE